MSSQTQRENFLYEKEGTSLLYKPSSLISPSVVSLQCFEEAF